MPVMVRRDTRDIHTLTDMHGPVENDNFSDKHCRCCYTGLYLS